MLHTPVYSHPGFLRLEEHFYRQLMLRNPLHGSWLGEHEHDSRLPETGAGVIDKDIALFRSMRDAFVALPERELSPDERLDREIALHIAAVNLFDLEDLQRWRHGIDLAMSLGHGLFLLFVRDFAPLATRVEAIISRLRATPMYLMEGRSLFQDVPAAWGETIMDSTVRVAGLIEIIGTGIQRHVPATVFNSFQQAAKTATDALLQFRHWFEHAIMPYAAGDFALGNSSFQAWLSVRKLGLTAQDLQELGESVLYQALAGMDRQSRQLIDLDSAPAEKAREEASKRVHSRRPQSFELTLDAYREAAARGRALIEQVSFIALPPDESIDIRETPEYLTHLVPFAAYFSPERGAKHQQGIYLITRPATRASNKGNPEEFHHSFADISHRIAFGAYPGHHLRFVAANRHPGKLRALNDSSETLSGWAQYSVEEMSVHGFDQTPEHQFVYNENRIRRACQLLIELNLQQKTWNIQQARRFLQEKCRISESAADMETLHATQHPGQALSHLAGMHLLRNLRTSLQRKFPGDLRDRDFHSLVIAEGCLPLFLAQRYFPEFIRESLKVHGN